MQATSRLETDACPTIGSLSGATWVAKFRLSRAHETSPSVSILDDVVVTGSWRTGWLDAMLRTNHPSGTRVPCRAPIPRRLDGFEPVELPDAFEPADR